VVLPRALLDPVRALAGGLRAILGAVGALIGCASELVAALSVRGRARGFALRGEGARLRLARLRDRLITLGFGATRALQSAVAVLLGLLGARQLARRSLIGLPRDALSGGLRGHGGLRADKRVLAAPLGVLGRRLGVSLPRLGAARSLARGSFCLLRSRGRRDRYVGRFVGLEPFASGGRLKLGGA